MIPPPLPRTIPGAEEAFRRYWKRAIPLILFPPVVFVAHELVEIPMGLVLAGFFLVAVLADLPFLLKKVPFGYVVYVMLASLAAAMAGGLLASLVRVLMAGWKE